MIYRILLLLLVSNTLVFAQRPSWTTSRVVGSPEPPKPYRVQRVYPNLQFNQPVELMPLADTGKMILLEVDGKLFTFDDTEEVDSPKLAIDVHPLINDFRRAFGFGVHPKFEENRQVFIVYAGNPVGRPEGSRLSRFVMSEDWTIDPASEEILLAWHSGGHNGCSIRFDSKGLMYFSAGDGSRPFPPDEFNVSQDLSDLRATICRIDVDHAEGDRSYAIPPDNPFVDLPGARGEIFAFGFRNPWRFTIDPESDRLYCGDVGWELWELVFNVQRGGNYGWSIFEGPQPIRADVTPGPGPLRKPLVSYPHGVGQSVTGGIVYRGKEHPELQGAYLYGDYVTGLLWGLRHEEEQVTWNPVLSETGLPIITFAESRDREVLVVGFDGGIHKLVKNQAIDQPSAFPTKLSETGLFESTAELEPAVGVISYRLTAPSWNNGATSQFVIGMPGTDPIVINQRQRAWKYPKGTVLAKTISVDDLRVETQLIHFNGIDWNSYSFLWNDSQTDADLVSATGVTKQFGDAAKTVWTVTDRNQCRSCHSRQHGGAVGFTMENLGPQQTAEFVHQRVFDRAAPEKWNVAHMVDPHDQSADLESRARSYLTANCAHCHSRGGGGTVPLDLLFSAKTESINAVDVVPTQGGFGLQDPKVICPGDANRSVLFYRMATSGMGHMPKLWTRDNDEAGLQLIHNWIESLGENEVTDYQSETSQALQRFSKSLFDSDQQARLATARAASKSGNLLETGLFERFLPAAERRKQLGSNIDVQEILAAQADAARGQQRFMNGLGQCIQCHRVKGGGQSVGPDLDVIGAKRSREQLLRSILQPSAEIDDKYRSHAVLDNAGTVTTGLKVLEDDTDVIIQTADGKSRRIAQNNIEAIKVQAKSLMPEGLAAEMTKQELADLLAFLSSLK